MKNERYLEALVVYDNERLIVFEMDQPKRGDSHWDEGVWVEELDGEQIEISFRHEEGNAWGAGGGEYVSSSDIKAMADCIRSVINKEKTSAAYMCLDDIFKIELSYNSSDETYTFTASMLETLIRDHYITVTKQGLTREALEEYIAPFFIWEEKYPVIGAEKEL